MATFETYAPGPPPLQMSPELRQFIDIELGAIAQVLGRDVLYTPPLGVEPEKPVNGMIAYADGTSWNPGSGEGFYGYQAGAWVKL